MLAAARIAGVDRVIRGGRRPGGGRPDLRGRASFPRWTSWWGPATPMWRRPSGMAYGTLDIDMVAGPSEVLVIADEQRPTRCMWLPTC